MSAVRTMKLGAEDYIPKKLLLNIIYERLEEIVEKRKRHDIGRQWNWKRTYR